MRITEGIAQIQAEAAAEELAAKQETERTSQEAEAAKLQARVLKDKRDEERKQAIITELSPFLEVVKAREQLQMIRDTVWQIGEVDPEPIPILSNHEDFKKLVLRLRAVYHQIESTGGDGEGYVYPSSDAIFINIEAVNRGVEGTRGIWVLSGLSEKSYFYSSRHLEFKAVSLEEPRRAYGEIEEMLVKVCIKLDSKLQEFPVQERSVLGFWNGEEAHFKKFRFGEEPKPAPTPPRKPSFFERIFGDSSKTYRSGNPPFYGGPSDGMH